MSWLLVILIQHLPDRLLSRAVWVGGELLCVLPGRVHILLNGSSQSGSLFSTLFGLLVSLSAPWSTPPEVPSRMLRPV